MTAAQFWALIEASLVRTSRHPERQRKRLVAALAALSRREFDRVPKAIL